MADFQDVRWWSASTKRDTVERLWSSVEACQAADKRRRETILHRVRMYGNRAFAGLGASQYHEVAHKRRHRLNVVKDVCDTAYNRLLGNRPKPQPLPIGGSNWSIRRRARLLDRFLQGQFRVSHVRPKMRRIVKDAIIVGDGFLKIGEDGERITVERVFSADLSVPPLEARAGEPLTMYQYHRLDREVAKALYPDAARKIDRVERSAYTDDPWRMTTVDTRADQIDVVEGWRLPSKPGAGDGRHVVATRDVVLWEREWPHDYFPFVHLPWDQGYLGYWSDSLVDVVEGQQVEINRLVKKVAMANDLGGHALLAYDASSKINRRKIVNQPLALLPYMGERPQLLYLEGASPQTFDQIQALKQEARELSGVYQAGSEGVPAGLESGEAIKSWNSIGQIRFRDFGEAFEEAHIELARQIIDRARDLAERNGGFGAPAARDKHSLDRIDWSEIDMRDDEYVLAVYPTSSLPDDPAGRVAAVEALGRAGVLPPDRLAHLLDFPDLEGGFLSLDRAAYEHAERQIETMLDEGKRQHPSPFGDLRLMMTLANNHLLQAEQWGVPEDRLQLLRDYLTSVKALLDKAQREQIRLAQEAGAATGGQRTGEAGAPPAQGVSGVAPGAVGAGDGAMR